MRIGQPFFKINDQFALSTFEEHQFDVVFVIGINKTPERSVVVTCNSVKCRISELEEKNRYVVNPAAIVLDVDVDVFMRSTDTEQNDLFRNEVGYYSDPEDLRGDYNTLALADISKERLHIQQETDRLDYIEDEINNSVYPFTASLVNNGAAQKGDTFQFQSEFGGDDTTKDTEFIVNGVSIGQGNNSYVPANEGAYTVRAEYQTYFYEFTFNVI